MNHPSAIPSQPLSTLSAILLTLPSKEDHQVASRCISNTSAAALNSTIRFVLWNFPLSAVFTSEQKGGIASTRCLSNFDWPRTGALGQLAETFAIPSC